MIEASTIGRMYSQIVQGVTKDASTLVTDDEHGQLWDTMETEVGSLRGQGLTFEIPFDDDTETFDEFKSMGRHSPADLLAKASPADTPPATKAPPADTPPADTPPVTPADGGVSPHE